MIERQNDEIVVHSMKWAPEFSRIADAGSLFQMLLVGTKKTDELGCGLTRETKHHAMINLVFGAIHHNGPKGFFRGL